MQEVDCSYYRHLRSQIEEITYFHNNYYDTDIQEITTFDTIMIHITTWIF